MKNSDKASVSKLAAYSIVYGLILINYIDLEVKAYAFHVWLITMYFAPFIVYLILRPEDWKLAAGLGLLSSLMNDVFYGPIKYLIGKNIDLCKYYFLWLVPTSESIFNLDFGFFTIKVFSWMMALSIYSRIILIYLFLTKTKTQLKSINFSRVFRKMFSIQSGDT
jgi:hypothetical protein